MYRVTYELPQEDRLCSLPVTTLTYLLEKNGLKSYGTKQQKVARLIGFFKSVIGVKGEMTITTNRDFRKDMEVVEVIKRGKVHSSFYLLSVESTRELLASLSESSLGSTKVSFPVFCQDYQEE